MTWCFGVGFIRVRICVYDIRVGGRIGKHVALGVTAVKLVGVQAHLHAHHGPRPGGGIRARAADQGVRARTADQGVVLIAAVEHVIAGAAGQASSSPSPPSSMSAPPRPCKLVHAVPVAGQHVVVPGTYNVLDLVIAPVNNRITVGIAATRRAV